jgi:hypothetical protein
MNVSPYCEGGKNDTCKSFSLAIYEESHSFAHRSTTHFELIFMKGIECVARFLCCIWMYTSTSIICWKDYSIMLSWWFVKDQLIILYISISEISFGEGSIYIYVMSFEIFLLSSILHLLIKSRIYLFKHIFMYIYVMHWAIIQYYSAYFVAKLA